METPLKSYDDSIAGDATNTVRANTERLWTAKIELQRLVKTFERARCEFFEAVVEETWILPLKEETTFYNKAPLRDFFNRLKNSSGGLEATNIVSLLSAMLGWWAKNPSVPKYVNRLKDAQKKSVRANLPISYMWLAAIATGLILAAGGFPKQRPNWDSLHRANKTWDAWRTTFRAHQLTLEREQRATGKRGGVFSSAAADITICGITTTTANLGALLTPDTLAHHAASEAAYQPAREFALQALGGHLDRMANAAMNSVLTLHQLTNANTRLASTTTKQYDAITRLLSKIKLWSASPGTGDTTHDQTAPNQQTRAIKTLQAAVKNLWAIGSFCSTHDW